MTVQRALISVSDKTGLVDFAKGLSALGIEILSTGGTASLLEKEGVKVIQVQDFTGAPEALGGRVKTLHPKVHGGILARRKLASDQADIEKQGLQPIDLVVVNLYPFREAVAKGLPHEQVIENIDIGGARRIPACGEKPRVRDGDRGSRRLRGGAGRAAAEARGAREHPPATAGARLRPHQRVRRGHRRLAGRADRQGAPGGGWRVCGVSSSAGVPPAPIPSLRREP